MKLTKRPDLERGLSSMATRNAEYETERPKQLKRNDPTETARPKRPDLEGDISL
jgi:hypothetical protein